MPPDLVTWLELPLARTNFHGPKGVWAIEVRLISQRGLIVACRDLPIICFPVNFWGLAILKKLIQKCASIALKFGIVTFIFN